MTTAVKRLDCLISNAYLIGTGRERVLVDTGSDFAYGRLRRQLYREGVSPGDLKLVILTHAHPDHAGSAARLKRDFGAQIAIHATEASWVRSGTTELYQPCGFFGHVLDRVIPRKFEACEVDRELDGTETIDLGSDVGALRLVHTPGHTPGHMCVEHADGELCAGDLMRGGMLRGGFVGGPFFVQSRADLLASVRRIEARCPRRLHFGHGKPAPGAALATFEL